MFLYAPTGAATPAVRLAPQEEGVVFSAGRLEGAEWLGASGTKDIKGGIRMSDERRCPATRF